MFPKAPLMLPLSRLAAGVSVALLMRSLRWVPPGGRSWLARRAMRDRRHPGAVALADFCAKALLTWKNKQYDIDLNGESRLLERLALFAPTVVFDVGANVGDWSLAAARYLAGATIHAFEIAGSTAAVLAANTAAAGGRIRANAFGLGSNTGEVTIHISPSHSTATTMLDGVMAISAPEHGITDVATGKARVMTGDAYLQTHGIERIDFLKIDVEGAEFAVLEGFAGAFARGAIDLVQFEYGPLNLVTRRFLADYYRFFQGYDFQLGKLYPEGVAFQPFTPADEDFVGPNYVACRAARADLIAALRCPPLSLG